MNIQQNIKSLKYIAMFITLLFTHSIFAFDLYSEEMENSYTKNYNKVQEKHSNKNKRSTNYHKKHKKKTVNETKNTKCKKKSKYHHNN